MTQDLIPLFLTRGENGEIQKCGVAITVNGETYKASSFIGKIAESIEEEVEALISAKETGELTVAAYLLLESLHRAGMVKTADTLLSDPTALSQSATCFAIGMRAGMIIPEGVQFETQTTDSDISVRNITTGEDEEDNEYSCD
jgi:hypothetical protein